MFNAQSTVDQTLDSICRQTYSSLDIIVVDDGSTDASADIVADFARKDSRIRLLRQANAGVAAARNRGAASTSCDFLAFVDADDLWDPYKIELQMQAMIDGGAGVGLVYCWFAQIDGEGRVFSLQFRPRAEGHVLQELCRHNFIGNGSSMLLRRYAFERVGGFDPTLRARKAQGCEDLLICLRIAESFEFKVVPRHLVGYRITNHNMSSDVMQMYRSCEIVLSEFRLKYPQYAPELDSHLVNMTSWLSIRALLGGKFLAACALTRNVFRLERMVTIQRLPWMANVYIRARLVPGWLKSLMSMVSGKDNRYRPLYTKEKW